MVNKNTSIQFKAAFLLVVFSLNTIVGFACAMGVDMGFNSKHHHHDEEEVSVIEHHHENTMHHHHDEEKPGENKSKDDDNCCNKHVVKFSQSDKLLAQIVNAEIKTPVTLIFLHSFYTTYFAPFFKTVEKIQVSRRCFINSPDIRVSIRSFQI